MNDRASNTGLFTFHVEGAQECRTYLPTPVRPFDEMFEVVGEHPAEALEKLVGEIEWGILDSAQSFTITFIPEDAEERA